ncbi:hypothetical protein P7C70_g1451, partial [Phenoliferia sp. Uapishka_3]
MASTRPIRAAPPPPISLSPALGLYTISSSPTPTSLKELIAIRGKAQLPPSPALSSSSAGGFSSYSVFDSPNELQSPTFHFPQHHHDALDNSTDTHQLADQASEVAGYDHDLPLPPSPQSFGAGLSDYSPSISLASVRTAKIAVLETATREVLMGQNGRGVIREGAQGLVESTRVSIEEEQVSLSTSSSWRTDLDSAVARITITDATASKEDAIMDPSIRPEVDAMTRMKSILGQSPLDRAYHLQTLTHCVGCSGPRMKIISPAPWDAEDDDTRSITSTTTSIVESSTASIRGRRSTETAVRRGPYSSSKALPKENVKPSKEKANTRTRSFSVLTSRRATPDLAEHKASSEEALRGLGLGLSVPDSPSTQTFASSISDASSNDSAKDIASQSRSASTSPVPPRKTTPTPEVQNSFAFPSSPTPPSNTLSAPSPQPKSYKSSSRGRSPTPIVFEMIAPGSQLPQRPIPEVGAPKSAPANMASFTSAAPGESTMPRSASTASLSVRIPPLKASGSLHSLASGMTSPSVYSPNHSSTSPASPTGFFSTPTSPTGVAPSSPGPGYKLISLAEARKRELERVAQAAAQRKAMLPVEHIAGRNEVSYGTSSESRSSSGASRAVLTSPLPSTSTGPGSASATSSTSPPFKSTTTTTPPAVRELKSKKSGFLKRMMGGEKPGALPPLPDRSYSDPPVTESFRSLPDDYVHPSQLSVTVSSPVVSASVPATATSRSPIPTSTNSTMNTNPTTGGRVAFLSAPAPSPDLRIRKGLAPSLSLRPISMAFSAGLPMDFLAEKEKGGDSSSYLTPKPLSPTNDGNLQSPFAPSFRSGSSTRSTMFDSDAASLTSSTAVTPITPTFSPLIPYFNEGGKGMKTPGSAEGEGGFARLQEEYLRERMAWGKRERELEGVIKGLRVELEEARSARERAGREGSAGSGSSAMMSSLEDGEGRCDKCRSSMSLTNVSVLARPRPLQGNNSTGSLFGSGVAPS